MDKLSANPFVVKNKYSILDRLKFAFLSPLALVRVSVCILCFVFVWITANGCYRFRQIVRPNNIYVTKRYFMWVPIFFYRCAIGALGFYRVRVISAEKPEISESEAEKLDAPIILLCPHSSVFDTLAVCRYYYLTVVSRAQIMNAWIVAKLALLNNPILVKREDSNSRKTVINDLVDRTVNKKEQVLILPEGTNGNRQFLLKFKNGAFIPGLPVQPLVIRFQLNDALFKDIDHVSWTWEGPSIPTLFWMSSCKLWTTTTIIKLPVYFPSEEEKSNPSLYALNVHDFVAKKTNLRKSIYSYDDVRFLPLCIEAGIPRSPCCIKLVKLCNRIAMEEYKKYKDQTKSRSPHDEIVKKVESGKVQEVDPDTISIGSRNSIEYAAAFDEKTATVERLLDVVSFVRDTFKAEDKLPIKNKEEMLDVMEIPSRYPALLKSSATEDFYFSLSGIDRSQRIYGELTVKELMIVIVLCDIRQPNLWDRVKDCVDLLGQGAEQKVMTTHDFKDLVWYLLGLEHSIIPDSVFDQVSLTFSYLQQNLVKTFKRAVEENARDLLQFSE